MQASPAAVRADRNRREYPKRRRIEPVYRCLKNHILDIPASILVAEDRFDGGFKETRQFEGQRKTGVELARLDGVDRLARDLQPLGQIGLRPVAFSAQYSQPVFHLYLA